MNRIDAGVAILKSKKTYPTKIEKWLNRKNRSARCPFGHLINPNGRRNKVCINTCFIIFPTLHNNYCPCKQFQDKYVARTVRSILKKYSQQLND